MELLERFQGYLGLRPLYSFLASPAVATIPTFGMERRGSAKEKRERERERPTELSLDTF